MTMLFLTIPNLSMQQRGIQRIISIVWQKAKKTDKELFSTCFEFGTIGDEFFDTILSLKYTVDENRNHWYPTKNTTSAEVVKENYYELFYPTEKEWREKTIEDFKTATKGVLDAKLK